MIQIDIRGASIDAITKKIGNELRAYAKRYPGGINALVDHSGVPRSTLNRLFQGKSVGVDVLFRVLRSLERWEVLLQLIEPPSLTPVEKLTILRKQGKFKPKKTAHEAPKPYVHSSEFHVKLADREAILASLKNKK